jgi:hypothetical protein
MRKKADKKPTSSKKFPEKKKRSKDWMHPASPVPLDPVARLTHDLKTAAITLSPHEARYLVDTYYTLQDYRKAASNQVFALDKSKEPHDVLSWVGQQTDVLESQILRALDAWSDGIALGKWAKSICGIGPVISAGLLAYIDIAQCPTVGRIWRFAGLDPTQHWLGKEKGREAVEEIMQTPGATLDGAIPFLAITIGCRPETLRKFATTKPDGTPCPLTVDSLIKASAKRPWNAGLKVLCWKIGESFVKVSGSPNDFYGKLYLERKAIESRKNEAGDYAEQAADKLKRFRIGKSTDAYQYYSKGKLPPAHIHARAKRWTVKLFLAHYHTAAFRLEGKEPPKPYVMEHLGHIDMIEPPNL